MDAFCCLYYFLNMFENEKEVSAPILYKPQGLLVPLSMSLAKD